MDRSQLLDEPSYGFLALSELKSRFQAALDWGANAMKDPTGKIGFLLGAIFLVELSVMLVTDELEIDMTGLPGALLDAATLTIVVSFVVLRLMLKPLQEALESEHAKAQVILDGASDAIITIDERGIIQTQNRAARHMLGFSDKDAIGSNISIIVPPPHRERHDKYLENYLRTGLRKVIGEMRQMDAMRKDGSIVPIEMAVSEVQTGNRRVFTAILRDITERRQAEQAREKLMRQLETLSERLATAQEEDRRKIAHELHEELGQELMTLKLFIEILGPGRKAKQAKDNRDAALAAAVHVSKRVSELVQDLAPPELEYFGLDAAVRTYSRRQAVAGRWNLHLDCPKPEVRAPRSVERACFRVLQEGLSNVLHHANATEVWVHLHQGIDELELRIRDNGIGFDRSVFHDEKLRENGSIGIFGMQIRAKQVAGVVKINSSVGNGTEVDAVFPLTVDSAEPV
ncbi:MAG: PAS domain S-box protein [Burkholderiales bacterium]|nr:PAS domain S-box protein [Burkholderiales bacterium]